MTSLEMGIKLADIEFALIEYRAIEGHDPALIRLNLDDMKEYLISYRFGSA